MEHARRYYPDTFQDFSESGFGSLMMDTVAYIGDMLSFYLDYQANETFLDTATEYDNILRLGRQMGYKYKSNPSSFGEAQVYILIPSNPTGSAPNYDYAPILEHGTVFTTASGKSFTTIENVDFSLTSLPTQVAKVDVETGIPTAYAVQATVRVISGAIKREQMPIGPYQKFLKLRIADPYFADIISVVDSDGHEYYEVDHLSQDVVYKESVNADRQGPSSIIKPIHTPRRFVVERSVKYAYLQFGHGSDLDVVQNSYAEPSDVIMDVHGRNYVSDTTFDPANLSYTDKFGIAPSNVTLQVTYRSNTSDDVNTAANTIVNVEKPSWYFRNNTNLSSEKINFVRNSLEVNNSKPISGDVSLPSAEEMRFMVYDSFATQNRAVTKQDYEYLSYAMPPQFGSIKRSNIVRDLDSLKRNLNLYVLSESAEGYLAPTHPKVKQNLKTWLQKNKMLTDTIDIIDGKVVNLQIEFTAIAKPESNKYNVLNRALSTLKEQFSSHMYMGETFFIQDIWALLKEVEGVLDVTEVKVEQKIGALYADTRFSIRENTSPDGRLVKVPENVVLEIKYPDSDIVGTIK